MPITTTPHAPIPSDSFDFQAERMPTPDAASYIGTSMQFLRSNIVTKRHDIPYIKIGRKVYYLKSDLDAWLLSRRVTVAG